MADTITTQSKKRAEIRAKLTMAVRRMVRSQFRSSPLYGLIVKAVIEAEKGGLTRAIIARTIRAELEAEKQRRLMKDSTGQVTEVVKVHKGQAARYVILARYEQGKFLKHEIAIKTVEIEGHTYTSPVKALMSGRHSFTRVYRTWHEAAAPAVVDLGAIPVSPAEATERALKTLKLTIRVKKDGKEVLERVKLLESREALEALLSLLAKSELGQQVLKLSSGPSEIVRRPFNEPRRPKAKPEPRVVNA